MPAPFWLEELKETLMAVIGLSAGALLLIVAYLVYDVTTRPVPCESPPSKEVTRRWPDPIKRINTEGVDVALANSRRGNCR